MSYNVLLLPGDGIGPELLSQVKKVSNFLEDKMDLKINYDEADIGGVAIDNHGNPLPQATIDKAKKADAVLLTAIGGDKWANVDFDIRPEAGLLGIRKEMGLYANLRPALVFDALADSSSLKKELVSGLDLMIVRELTGGIYFGSPAGIETRNGEKVGFNTLIYSESEIERIAHVAFKLAMQRDKKLCSVDKANVLNVMVLWREVVTRISKEYPQVELSHLYVDNASMQLVRNPKQFDTMLMGNMFGDILSDTASMLTGSLGMLPSASLGDTNPSTGKQSALYEPVHGSAPDIAGQNKANPLAQLLSFSMMLRYSFNEVKSADLLEKAIQNTLSKNIRTTDISNPTSVIVGTQEMGDAVVKEMSELLNK